MATLTIKHGARPRYLPKKITNYTYVERGNKRVLDYTYTETNIVPSIDAECVRPAHYPSECYTLHYADGRKPTRDFLITADGQTPSIPVWEYTYRTRTLNSGTVYEFSFDVITQAKLMCNGNNVKIISFDESANIIAHIPGEDYHELNDTYTMSIYNTDTSWTKITGTRSTLHTFWRKRVLRSEIIDGRTIYFVDEDITHEEYAGTNGNPVGGTVMATGNNNRNTAYNCEVKLELEEE